MAFQFRCPNGCLLEGDPSQAGTTIPCPTCGQWFAVPAPAGAAASGAGPSPAGASHTKQPQPQPSPEAAPQSADPEQPPTSPRSVLSPSVRTLTFRCSKGHQITAPRELAGREAVCPECEQRVVLNESESLEHQAALEQRREQHEARVGAAWLVWAIAVAVAVLGGLILLLIRSALTE